ncbi:TPM domain-containing protein [Panacagrimonas sp.]|uniref:TPM domain-containing protein n=1 Tax=Panacagrimonas sp. TaxID=2480088 RepID=UPI003B5223A5
MRILWILAVTSLTLALSAPGAAARLTIPPFTPNVVDPGGYLDAAANQRVNLELQRIREESRIWGAVFILEALEGEPIENVAVEAFEQWQLGEADADNGLLLVLAMNDRESRFEVGYGLEGTITDVAALRALDAYLAPKMREGDVAAAIADAFGFLSRLGAQDPDALRELEHPSTADDDMVWKRGLIAWGVFLLPLWLCVPIRNAWVAYRRDTLLGAQPALALGDEQVVRTPNHTGRWGLNWGVLAFLSINPGVFVFFLSAMQPIIFYLSLAIPLLVVALVAYLSGRKYGSPERYRRFLDNIAKQRADLIGKGHLEETAPGRFSYTPAYHASRASSSSSSGGSSYSSSSGGGSSGGGGASSRW